MSDNGRLKQSDTSYFDELAEIAAQFESAVEQQHFTRVAELLETQPISIWFGIPPSRTYEIMGQILQHLPANTPILRAADAFFSAEDAGDLDAQPHLSTVNFSDPLEVQLLTTLRMFNFRLHGHLTSALEQAQTLESGLGTMQSLASGADGGNLHSIMQIGVTAMLAGDFTRALTNFMRAEMQPLVPKYAFLTRDALTKAALIHACFGNSGTAVSMLDRAERIARTSSWVEAHIDAHRDFARVLTTAASPEETIEALEAINLHNIGELWPFYIFAVHRVLEGAGYHDELSHRFHMLAAMPFKQVEGDGFAGSVIPLKRGLIALRAGRIAEAQGYLDRADQSLLYTRLLQAASHLYAVRPQQAKHEALLLRSETRGFRLMEVRRLAILAAAYYLDGEIAECLDTLKHAAELPDGLQPSEVVLFSPDTRELAREHVPDWTVVEDAPSAFLWNVPEVGVILTEREIEIVQHLAQGHSRAEIAQALFITINTLKTHLKSIYRKLQVSSASEAVIGAQQRGLL